VRRVGGEGAHLVLAYIMVLLVELALARGRKVQRGVKRIRSDSFFLCMCVRTCER
jgi:hypothetical protein